MIILEDVLKCCIDNNITYEELILLAALYQRRNSSITILMRNYAKALGVDEGQGKAFSTKQAKVSLIQKGYLIETELTGFDKFQLTERAANLFVSKQDAIFELYAAYPGFININGANIPVKTGNINTAADEYWKAIGGIAAEHRRVLEDVKQGIRYGLLNMKIQNFINGRVWLDIRQRTQIQTQTDGALQAKDF